MRKTLETKRAPTKHEREFHPSEDFECVHFVKWLELKIAEGAAIRFSHLPLETHTSPIQAKRLQRLGVRRGVPDYLLIIKGRVHFIEMKREKGGRLSPHQIAWIDALNIAGVGAHVCEGASEAKRLVLNLLDA